MLLSIAQHAEVDAYRTRDEVTVGVASRTSVDGAGVHARTTTDTLKNLPVLRVANPLGAAVVDEDDVHLVSCRTSFTEVAGVGGCGLTRAGSAEHALEDGQALVVGDDLLQSDGGDVQLGT